MGENLILVQLIFNWKLLDPVKTGLDSMWFKLNSDRFPMYRFKVKLLIKDVIV